MKRVTTIIIGAGQSGLAMSHSLARQSVEHVILERGRVANTWRTERWNSLRLLTPNWQSRLPGHEYHGTDPHGFRTLIETIRFFDDYARKTGAPIETLTTVLSVKRLRNGYRVQTDRGDWECLCLVLANGAMTLPALPEVAADRPSCLQSLAIPDYKRPCDIVGASVLIVGASASGVQLAEELALAGRNVFLSVGEHVRVPRRYRGHDILWLMNAAGYFDHSIADVDDLSRVRTLPSFQLVGSTTGRSVDLNRLQKLGVKIVGRLTAFRGGRALFSGNLHNVCRLADLKMQRLLRTLDAWIDESLPQSRSLGGAFPNPTLVPDNPELVLDLKAAGIDSILWATGLKPDYSFLDLPVFDARGRLMHDGGVVGAPGVYVLGLPFMRTRKSSLIDGAADDAKALAAHLVGYLNDSRTQVA
ncbi:MAG: NAD(P)/FAD-dependent oxidoreductase [Pseudomonadota bacterium]